MRFTPTLALALLVAALAPGAASAASIIVRPNGTQLVQAPWAVSPAGPAADVTLADPVTQPAAPSVTGATLTAGFGIDAYTKVSLPTPSVPAGVTPSSVTVWVYASVGFAQALTASLSSGGTMLGFAPWIPGPAAWHSFKPSPVPTAAQLSQLVLALRSDSLPGSLPTKVYAAYVQVDVPDVAGPSGLPVSLPRPTGGAQPADVGGGDDPAQDPSGDASGPVTSATVSGPATIQMPAGAQAVPVQVACPADQGGPCRGRVRIELAGAAATRTTKTKAKARAARCARGCRVLGDASFTVAAGKKAPVRVRLRPAAFKMLPRGRTVKARVTVTSRDQSGRLTTVTRAIAIHRARN